MKKLFALLFLASAVLSSCSSDNDSFAGGDINIKTEKYPVKFSVKSQGFEVDKSQLKSFSETKADDNRHIFQVVVYDEAGKPYLDSLLLPEEVSKLITKDNTTLPLSLELPEGKYSISLMYTAITPNTNYITPQNLRFVPKDYSKDTYGGGVLGLISGPSGSNIYNYYQTTNISVSNATAESIIPIVLEPMWSNVEVIIEDPKTFEVPANTIAIKINVEPSYNQYSIKTKLATDFFNFRSWQGLNKAFTLSDIRNETKFKKVIPVSKTSKENNNRLRLNILYLGNDSNDPSGIGNIISEKIIDLDQDLENGFNYTVKGKLGKLTNANDSQTFSITLGEFSDKEINF